MVSGRFVFHSVECVGIRISADRSALALDGAFNETQRGFEPTGRPRVDRASLSPAAVLGGGDLDW